MGAPRRLLEHLGAAGADTLETAATIRLQRADGDRTKRAVWIVRAGARLWLGAATKGAAWTVEANGTDDVRVQRGLTRDTIVVAGHAAPLALRTHDAAKAIVEAFAAARAVADPVPTRATPPGRGVRIGADATETDAPPETSNGESATRHVDTPRPAGAVADRTASAIEDAASTDARALDHAMGVEPWWRDVPSPADDPWLFGVATASTFAFVDASCQSVEAPLVVGVRERGLAVAAHRAREGAPGRWGVEGVAIEEDRERTLVHAALEGEVEHRERIGRDDVRVGEWKLVLSDDDAVALVELAKRSGAGRLAWLLDHALARRDVEAVRAYLGRILPRDDARVAAAPALAVLTWRAGEPNAALASLTREGVERGALADARRRVEHVDAVMNDDLRADLDGSTAAPPDRTHVDMPSPPRGLGWPPPSVDVLWAAAAALAGEVDEAVAHLEDLPEPTRAHARLALRAHIDVSAVDDTEWRAVAEQLAASGDVTTATDTALRALERAPSAALHLRVAAWGWLDGRRDEALAALVSAAALGPDPDDLGWLAAEVRRPPEQTPNVAQRLFGKLAKLTGAATDEDVVDVFVDHLAKHDHPRVAAQLVVERAFLESNDDQLAESATRCADELHAPKEAALLVEALARRADEREEETGAYWLRAAAYRAQAHDQPVATRDLESAIAADFLRPPTYRAALTTQDIALPSDLETWWRHLLSALEGGASSAPLARVERLDAAALDRLHPSGVGWLEHLRRAVQEVEPPDFTTLTRGLERLTLDNQPRTAALVDALATALGIAAPECFLYRGDDAYGACAWPIERPVLLIGHRHLEPGPLALDEAALRFVLAVELTHLACRHPLLSFEADFLGTSHSVYQTFGRFAGTAETLVDVVTLIPGVDQVAKLQRIVKLSRRVFTAKSAVDKVGTLAAPLAKLFGDGKGGPKGIGRDAAEGAALQFRLQADRAALLLGGDFAAAVEAILAAAGRTEEVRAKIREGGLAAALESDALEPVEKIRLSALAEFAAKQMPWTPGHGAAPGPSRGSTPSRGHVR